MGERRIGIKDSRFMERFMKNYDKAALEVFHANLKPWANGMKYARLCPDCKDAALLMARDEEKGFELKAEDHCIGCGRRVIYKDIEQLRLYDRGKAKYPEAQPT